MKDRKDSLPKDRNTERLTDELAMTVVGIGASAGGIKALSSLVSALPGDTGMAFVVIMHLDPTHESSLGEILSRKTELPVASLEEESALKKDHIYVMAPNTEIVMENGSVKPIRRKSGTAVKKPINRFFKSLADNTQNHAIGVILSGEGDDGSSGIAAIKEGGGITIAQHPTSAEHSSMPTNAIATGCVDFTLTPEKIAEEIKTIAQHPVIREARLNEQPSETEQVTAVLSKLYKTTGIDFSQYKHTTVRRRLQRRMVVHKIESMDRYAKFIEENPLELRALLEDMLIKVTDFFREPPVFEKLKIDILPKLLKENTTEEPLRIWVPACSTGEELYSIAIVVLEILGRSNGKTKAQFFGTDISESAIQKARQGIYPKEIEDRVSLDRIKQFFVPVEGGYQITKTIRDMCIFAIQDITKDPPFSRIDLISCCNLLIYFGATLQKKVIPLFHYGLNPKGYLVLGRSESISRYSDAFQLVDKKTNIYSKKFIPRDRLLPTFPSGFGKTAAPVETSTTRKTAPALDETTVLQKADEIILKELAPAGFVVNENLDILQYRGNPSRYIRPPHGSPSLNLLKQIHPQLRTEIHRRVEESKQSLRRTKGESPVRIDLNDSSIFTVVTVTPILVPNAQRSFFIVTFSDSSGSPVSEKRVSPGSKKRRQKASRNDVRVRELEEELVQTREQLQAIIEQQETTSEELRSANEEVLSSNEELQSTNEELETSKEELQSSNEELSTVNEELHNRNAELGQTNDDLQNILSSTRYPMVVLGRDLRIRRFTPEAENIFRLIPSDIGRPITDISPSFPMPEIKGVSLDVIDAMQTREMDVSDGKGNTYILQIRPYRTAEAIIEGVIVALVDITDRQNAEELSSAMVSTVKEPLLVLSDELVVVRANRSFFNVFDVEENETIGHKIYELGNGQWDIPELRQLLEEVLPQKKTFDDFMVTHRFKSLGERTMLLNARQVGQGERPTSILLAIEDVTSKLNTALDDRFKVVIDSSPVGMFLVNAQGKIVLINRQMEKLFGYKTEELLNERIEKLIPARFRPNYPQHLEDYLKHPESQTLGAFRELYGVRKDGTEIPIEIVLTPITRAVGLQVLATVTDISERKSAMEAKQKDVLLKEIHHRVKNNLNVVSNLLTLQSDHIKDEKALAAFKDTQNRIRSIALIHERLYKTKELSRVNYKAYLNDLINALFHSFGVDPKAHRPRIDVASDVQLGVDSAVPCSLIVGELVSNSLKHAFPKEEMGEIRINLELRADKKVFLSVSDNGLGFPKDIDFRNTKTLGLQLVMILTQQLGGEIGMISDKGTTFNLIFRPEFPGRLEDE